MGKEKVRFVFIDLLRGWALLVMIEVHIFNVMLMPSLKETDWFNVLNFINGLVAPSFLFISGFAFMLSTQSNAEELRKFGKPFWKKLGRIFLILIAGYSLHIPILSHRRVINFYTSDVILKIYNVDILQCIGAGLLILLVARMLIRSDKKFNIFTIAAFIFIAVIAPVVWQIDFGKYVGVPVAAYFNPLYGSFFPLFPWLAFLFAGAIACRYYMEARNQLPQKLNADSAQPGSSNEKKFVKALLTTGFIIAAIGHILLSGITPGWFRSAHPHPLFFVQRLGYVFMLLAACWYYAEYRQTKSSFVIDVGRESLLVYWLHLQLIYRKIWSGRSIAENFGGVCNIAECIIGTILLVLLMIYVAKYWGLFKRKYRSLSSNLTLGFVTAIIIIFFIGF